jgi:hypothetical protein
MSDIVSPIRRMRLLATMRFACTMAPQYLCATREGSILFRP